MLFRSSDGNTLFDECAQETPAGQYISFTTKDTVNADFSYNITLGCKTDIVRYSHPGTNGVNSWLWTFGEVPPSTLQNPIVNYTIFGIKHTRLIVTNGVCYDTSYADINLPNTLKAGFEGPEFICPDDQGSFRDTSVGAISAWQWDFGNGSTSSLQNPPQQTYTDIGSNYDEIGRAHV